KKFKFWTFLYLLFHSQDIKVKSAQPKEILNQTLYCNSVGKGKKDEHKLPSIFLVGMLTLESMFIAYSESDTDATIEIED
ncbi:hypothetical protein ACJX0J_034586, partial [Zea mays]